MSNEKRDLRVPLELIHVCEKCRAPLTYAQVPEDVTVTGIVECPVCGHVGRLFVEVREVPDENLK